MIIRIASFAALLVLALALPAQARAPEPQATLLLAQAGGEKTCDQDGRRVPAGARVCRKGQQEVCSARGRWERTGKRC